jgi:hypothetical protein
LAKSGHDQTAEETPFTPFHQQRELILAQQHISAQF